MIVVVVSAEVGGGGGVAFRDAVQNSFQMVDARGRDGVPRMRMTAGL